MIRFDVAGRSAVELAEDFATQHDCFPVVVRDLLGRNVIALAGDRNTFTSAETDELAEHLRRKCTPFLGPEPVILLDQEFTADLILESPDRRAVPESLSPTGRVTLIERTAVGADWLDPKTNETEATRVALYGFKGGVGRSTATFALAQYLASYGKVVLVVDLDLESPGVSTMLAPEPSALAEHGILDHLVEHAVGNADGLDLAARSVAVGDLPRNGEVWISAASGRPGFQNDGYLDKLNRAYVDVPSNPATGAKPMRFGERLEAAVSECERQVGQKSRPVDVVLLDSRSGIHDIGAVAITQLSELSLLFATDNPQTWQGYEQLFERWASRLTPNERRMLGERLQMVATMVPLEESDEYLNLFSDRSQETFAKDLYEPIRPDSELGDEFHYSASDRDGPHYPVPILHSNDLVGHVPGVGSGYFEPERTHPAYRTFLSRCAQLIIGEDTYA